MTWTNLNDADRQAFFADAPRRIHVLGEALARIRDARLALIVPGLNEFDAPEPPCAIIIKDILEDGSGVRAVGPGRFDRRSLKSLFRETFHAAIISEPLAPELYQAFALPLALGAAHVVIIETSATQHPKWTRFIKRFSEAALFEVPGAGGRE